MCDMYGNIATNMVQLVAVVESDWVHLHADSVGGQVSEQRKQIQLKVNQKPRNSPTSSKE